MDSFIYLFRILANCYAIKIIRNITDQIWGKCAYGLPGRGNQLVPCRWNLGWMRCWDRRRVGLAGRLRLKQIYHALFFAVSNSRLKTSKGFLGKILMKLCVDCLWQFCNGGDPGRRQVEQVEFSLLNHLFILFAKRMVAVRQGIWEGGTTIKIGKAQIFLLTLSVILRSLLVLLLYCYGSHPHQINYTSCHCCCNWGWYC